MDKKLLKQLEALQQKLLRAQEEFEKMEFEGSAGGGAVRIIITGRYEVKKVEIAPEVVNSEDAELLEDLVAAAANEALSKLRERMSRDLENLGAELGFLLR